jgi:hypothetical protein
VTRGRSNYMGCRHDWKSQECLGGIYNEGIWPLKRLEKPEPKIKQGVKDKERVSEISHVQINNKTPAT